MEMILYSTVGVADLARAIRFYDAVFSSLGIGRAPNWTDEWAGWGGSYEQGYGFWVCKPFNGQPPTPGNGTMSAFRAKDEAQVRAFHAAAQTSGGSEEGTPGTRPYYEPTFFVAYVRDPDGNKLACVFHTYQPGTGS
jgi:catechol 2,3-dioxygenase-like lactoylglutathione lyase family enzyme